MNLSRRMFPILVAGAVAAGCAAKYQVVSRESESQVLSGDCEVRLLDRAPDTGFTILGEVRPEDPAHLAQTPEEFLASFRERVCRLTGTAVIALKDEQGRYKGGTIIRTVGVR